MILLLLTFSLLAHTHKLSLPFSFPHALTNTHHTQSHLFTSHTHTHTAGLRPALVRALTHQSAAAVEWLMDRFNLDLSKVRKRKGKGRH